MYVVDISRPGYMFGLMVGSGHDYSRTSVAKDLMRRIVASVYLIPEKDFHPPKPRLVGSDMPGFLEISLFQRNFCYHASHQTTWLPKEEPFLD